MRIWQQLMIFLARNGVVKNFMQSNEKMSDLSTQFVGGRSAEDAVQNAWQLNNAGVTCSLFNLGEYVEDQGRIHQTMAELTSAARKLSEKDLDVHISVDPTQIGYQIGPDLCQANALELACEIKTAIKHKKESQRSFLMLDMEDAQVTQSTIDLFYQLDKKDLNTAITLQAYLYRTQTDLLEMIPRGRAVRLVKGAFAESRHIAFTRPGEIDANYLKLSKVMLSKDAARSGFYPIFGTHDDRIIDQIINMARDNGWQQGQYEFEMLYGVRPGYQKQLVHSGESLRLYLPFGTDWWPYAIRRVGESAKNLKFLLRALARNQ